MATKGTLKYRKVTRTPQSGPNKNKQMYYATAVTDREMNFEEFVTHISEHNSPYSRGTVHGVLMDTLDCLQELILDGKSVRLSDLGLFSIGMTSRAEATKDKVSAASVEGVHLIVRNTKTWSNAELRKKCRIEEYDTYGNTTDEGSVRATARTTTEAAALPLAAAQEPPVAQAATVKALNQAAALPARTILATALNRPRIDWLGC